MRIWDCFPAYLNKTLLLAEHRELHATQNLLDTPAAPAATDAQVVAWVQCPQAIKARHALLVEEMSLIDIDHHSGLEFDRGIVGWPDFNRELSIPAQFEQLRVMKGSARLPVPATVEELWQQCALSASARDPQIFRYLQSHVSTGKLELPQLMTELTALLREPVQPHSWERAISSMWDICAKVPEAFTYNSSLNRPERLIKAIQYLTCRYRWPELWCSTALTDLACCSFAD